MRVFISLVALYWVELFYIIAYQMNKVFANGPGNRGSIPVCVILKTKKMVLDATLFNI